MVFRLYPLEKQTILWKNKHSFGKTKKIKEIYKNAVCKRRETYMEFRKYDDGQ